MRVWTLNTTKCVSHTWRILRPKRKEVTSQEQMSAHTHTHWHAPSSSLLIANPRWKVYARTHKLAAHTRRIQQKHILSRQMNPLRRLAGPDSFKLLERRETDRWRDRQEAAYALGLKPHVSLMPHHWPSKPSKGLLLHANTQTGILAWCIIENMCRRKSFS